MEGRVKFGDRPASAWDFVLALMVMGGLVMLSIAAGCSASLQAPPQAWGVYYAVGGSCTCVPLGQRVVATAKHCVETLHGNELEAVELFEQGEPRGVVGSMVAEDADVAVLYLDRDIEVWEPVRGGPHQLEWAYYFSKSWVSHTCRVDFAFAREVMATCWPSAVAGDSGSPVVDADGRVWGVVSRSSGNVTIVATVAELYESAMEGR